MTNDLINLDIDKDFKVYFIRNCQNPNLTTTQRNLNRRLGFDMIIVVHTHTTHTTPHHSTPQTLLLLEIKVLVV